jgi:hypothetical protein
MMILAFFLLMVGVTLFSPVSATVVNAIQNKKASAAEATAYLCKNYDTLVAKTTDETTKKRLYTTWKMKCQSKSPEQNTVTPIVSGVIRGKGGDSVFLRKEVPVVTDVHALADMTEIDAPTGKETQFIFATGIRFSSVK